MEELNTINVGNYVRISKDVYFNIWKVVQVETELIHVIPVFSMELRNILRCSFPERAVILLGKTIAEVYNHPDYSMANKSW